MPNSLSDEQLIRLAERKRGHKLGALQRASIANEKIPAKKMAAFTELAGPTTSQEFESWRRAMAEEERILVKIAEGTAVIDPNADPKK